MAETKSVRFVKYLSKNFLDKKYRNFKNSKNSFLRLNIHNSANDFMHIMIMFYKKNFHYPPHYSINKKESFSVIRGKFKIIFYNKKKKPYKKIILNKKNFLTYKLNKNIYHKIIPLSSYCIALEILDGPYVKNSVKKFDE